jgi:hypothetical protein
LEHLNKLVVEPIDDILIFSMFEDIHIGHLAIMLETCENHLCVIMKYVFLMLEVIFFFSLIHVQLLKEVAVNLRRFFFLCFLGNHPKLVMHVQSILEMTGCCLHLLENFLYAHEATD